MGPRETLWDHHGGEKGRHSAPCFSSKIPRLLENASEALHRARFLFVSTPGRSQEDLHYYHHQQRGTSKQYIWVEWRSETTWFDTKRFKVFSPGHLRRLLLV